MIPVIELSDTLLVQGKTFAVPFRHNERTVFAYVPISQTTIKDKILYIADWLLNTKRSDIATYISAGSKCLVGNVLLKNKIENVETRKGSPLKQGFYLAENGLCLRVKEFKSRTILGVLKGLHHVTDFEFVADIEGIPLFWNQTSFRGIKSKIHTFPKDDVLRAFNDVLANTDRSQQAYTNKTGLCAVCGRKIGNREQVKHKNCNK